MTARKPPFQVTKWAPGWDGLATGRDARICSPSLTQLAASGDYDSVLRIPEPVGEDLVL